VKFLTDRMLGKFTRWLRMLGIDVIYSVQFGDYELLELAKREERVLLTKDIDLYKRAIGAGINAFYVEGKTEAERLAEIAERYDLRLTIDINKSYCSICNTKLKATPKEKLIKELKKNTLEYYSKFWRCPNCGQVYWQGAHWIQINNTLKEALSKLQKKN
jgi:uncharacterized protein with PIN domain